jgi:hypothetical protein
VRHGELAQRIAGTAHEALGWTVERIGEAPKLLLPYRTERPFKKIATPPFTLPGDQLGAKSHRVEVLADGQQWIAYHTHPDTGCPYHWPEGELPPRSDLPEIDEEMARGFIARAMELITSYGGRFDGEPDSPRSDSDGERAEPRGTLPAIEAALAFIPNDDIDYDTWIRTGMAIKAALGSEGWPLFAAWSAQSGKDDPAVTAKKWKSFRPERIGAGSLYDTAAKNGWRPAPELILNGAIAEAMEACPNPAEELLGRQNKAEPEQQEAGGNDEADDGRPWTGLPTSLKAPAAGRVAELPNEAPGALRRFTDWVLASASHPQPMLSLGAALVWYGTLMGQRYRLVDGPDTRSALYVLAVAESGAGKDHPRKCMKEVAMAMGFGDYLGEEVRSDAGVHSAVYRQNCIAYLIDEIGAFVEAVVKSRDGNVYLARVMDKFTTLWSSPDTIVKGPHRAEHRDANAVREDINQPCVGIYGSTVPIRLWGALNSSNFTDGSIPRFLLFDAGGFIPIRNKNAGNRQNGLAEIVGDAWAVGTGGDREPPLLRQAIETSRVQQPLPVDKLSPPPRKADPTLVDVHFDPAALAYDDAVGDFGELLKKQHIGKPSAAVVARYYEHVRRVTLVAAVADNPEAPLVRLAHARWAEELVRLSVARMVSALADSVADSEHEKKLNKVVAAVKALVAARPKEFKEGWVRRSDIKAKYRAVGGKELGPLLDDLVDTGLLERRGREIGGRPAEMYRIPSS